MALDLRQKVFRVPGSIAISVGLRWTFVGADPVDFDLSAVCFNKQGKFLDVVFFNHLFPEGTDVDEFQVGAMIDPGRLPYMFHCGDNTIGGEEENQLSGLVLAAKRRRNQFQVQTKRGKAGKSEKSFFGMPYLEDQLADVEAAYAKRRQRKSFAAGVDDLDEAASSNRGINDETITIIMEKIPQEAEVIFLCVTSYGGADFSIAQYVQCELFNESTNEKVGIIPLRGTTGSGTANLVCMLCRVPRNDASAAELENYGLGQGLRSPSRAARLANPNPASALWDLRELNIRTFGYTFVDVLPLMMDVMGVGPNVREDALRRLPDYSLRKVKNLNKLETPLSDLRFGVGWSGDHDVDAFLVMLDDQHNYVDHLHPKTGKIFSNKLFTAQLSGDAVNGNGTLGDEEFIDIVAHRIPSNVRTVFFGVNLFGSYEGGKRRKQTTSILDVKDLYLRMQNRSLVIPSSVEVDRWNVYEETQRADAAPKSGYGEGEFDALSRTYTTPDGTVRPVRALILASMIKEKEVTFGDLFPHTVDKTRPSQPDERPNLSLTRDTSASRDTGETVTQANDLVPVFRYYPLHDSIPVEMGEDVSVALPFLQCMADFRGGTALTYENVLTIANNSPLWVAPYSAAYSSLWSEMKLSGSLSKRYAVQVQLLEVRNLRPSMPDRWKCHGEMWVCAEPKVRSQTHMPSVYDNPVFRTPFLLDREDARWDERDVNACGLFLVSKFDRIRLMIYECATVSHTDLDLVRIPGLWLDDQYETPPSRGDGSKAYNIVEDWAELKGSGILSGELRYRVFRVPIHEAVSLRKRLLGYQKKDRNMHLRKRASQKQPVQNATCSVM